MLFKTAQNDRLLTDLPDQELTDIMTITILEKGKTPLLDRLLPTASLRDVSHNSYDHFNRIRVE